MDRDGFISNGELFLVLKMMVGNNLKDQQLQQIVDKTIMEADRDGDGKLSFDEFATMVSNTVRLFPSLCFPPLSVSWEHTPGRFRPAPRGGAALPRCESLSHHGYPTPRASPTPSSVTPARRPDDPRADTRSLRLVRTS